MSHNYLNLLGLAFRARKLTLGEEAIIDAIRSQQAHLVIIAGDASQNTTKKLTDKCCSYDVPFRIVDDRNTLSQAIGKQGRVAIAINDEGFSNKFMQLLPE
ncbi:ribosomal protein L7Ae-like RNA K-turn-binding protein [Alkalibacillus filiformis]|uniref:Ribosomal protein L7Ae-like RNA K-turn-binding protein n=1 Tax=Alkalibacillus filiformis TaxID=200990 RepID=A0ABU0DQP9_9BACI|nr:YlxQ family RNA-binding protein [Alkalibacillus filiformis]MDQ0350664.1 ribosomal protein L7Ae-like RNA K-turn-binding protein [Alkalibacillus filiformis]